MIDLDAIAVARAAEQMESFRWDEPYPASRCACGRLITKKVRRGIPICNACRERKRREAMP